jgi:sugar phosphate isomerase/epimerase
VQSGSLEGDLDTLLDAGQSRVAVLGASVRQLGAEAVARELRARGMSVSSYQSGLAVRPLDPPPSHQTVADFMADTAAIGATMLTMSAGPRGDLTFAQADEIYLDGLRRAAPLAQALGLTMLVEPIHPLLFMNSFIHTLRHAADLASQVEAAGVVVDTAHVFWDRNFARDLEASAPLLSLVQVGQLDAAALAEKRWARAPLDSGPVDVKGIVLACYDAGYRGVYEQENTLPQVMDRRRTAQSIAADAAWFDALWEGVTAS